MPLFTVWKRCVFVASLRGGPDAVTLPGFFLLSFDLPAALAARSRVRTVRPCRRVPRVIASPVYDIVFAKYDRPHRGSLQKTQWPFTLAGTDTAVADSIGSSLCIPRQIGLPPRHQRSYSRPLWRRYSHLRELDGSRI